MGSRTQKCQGLRGCDVAMGERVDVMGVDGATAQYTVALRTESRCQLKMRCDGVK